MKVLLLGGGGREHALAWLIAQSPLCEKLYVSPGNAGISEIATLVSVDPMKFDDVKDFVRANLIDLVVVGPEDPIVHGIADFFAHEESLKNVRILAPFSHGAMLEGSKDFAKSFMLENEIPTAAYKTFTADEYEKASSYIKSHPCPLVVKADGLAAGKGVTVCFSTGQAIEAIDELFLKNRFGTAGHKVVVEEYLDGIEMSAFVLTDGRNYAMLPEAKDYKRVGEGDTGPNTGGMGCVSPVPFADAVFMEKVRARIVEPTISGLNKAGITYRGFIFFGLMNVSGNPYVIEYNVRMGDPESEVVLPRINEDILPLLYGAAGGKLPKTNVSIKPEYAVTVMAVSGGYPGDYEKGKDISGLEDVADALVFHAGTKKSDGKVLTSGGRVLCITAFDSSLDGAMNKSYRELQKVEFDKKFFRPDIGKDLLKYLV